MRRFWKRCLAAGMSLAMTLSMLPSPTAAEVRAEGMERDGSILDTALANYDFEGYSLTDGNLVKGDSVVKLESVGTGKAPELVEDDDRGMVLSTTFLNSGLANKGTAVFDNPFEGQALEQGLTLNFWTKTTSYNENSCLISIETAPKNGEAMSSAFDITQGWLRWNATSQGGAQRYLDAKITNLGLNTTAAWKMVTVTVTKNAFKFYADAQEITLTNLGAGVDTYKTDFEEMMKDLIGTGAGVGAADPETGKKTKIRLGGTFVSHWPSAASLMDDVSFYGKALTAEEVTALYNETKSPALAAVAVDGENMVEVGKTTNLSTILRPKNVALADNTVTWASADSQILTVDNAGVATGVKEGKTTVTATVAGITSVPFEIEVIDSDKAAFNQLLKNFDLQEKIVTEDFELDSSIGENTSVEWSSSNPSAITIEKTENTITAKVTPADDKNQVVRLTAEITYTGTKTLTETKTFDVAVRRNLTVSNTAIVTYDFAQYSANSDGNLANGETVVTLEKVGNGKKPELVQDDDRGQVLSLTEQEYKNRGFALLPSNPFANKAVENGFTLNFWTKTTGTSGGGKCLIDFEVAPAADKRAGTFAVNQQMAYWNTTDQNSKFTDFNIGNNLPKEKGWRMVTMTVTDKGLAFYFDGVKTEHSISGSPDYEQIIKDLAGTSGICDDPAKTNVRLGASLATYWSCAGALMDEVSFYDKALSAKEIATLFEETTHRIVGLESVAVTGKNTVDEDSVIQLSVALTPEDTTVDKAVTWKSADETVVSIDQNGKVKGLKPGKTTVTATVAGIQSEPFEITVNDIGLVKTLESGKYYLTVYSTQKPFYASAGNLAQETRSVYMAVSNDGKNFQVLNNGGGVIFSSNTNGSLQITAPRIYKDAENDNKFTVVAQDANASKGFHVFTSEDGIAYYDDTIVESKELTVHPLKKSSFKLLLNEENILDSDETITLGNALELTEAEYNHFIYKLGRVTNTGLEELEELKVKPTDNITEAVLQDMYPSVNATYSDNSIQNFKIDWTGALNNVDLTQEGEKTVTGKVLQKRYLNNLKELNGSALPEDDPENVGTDFPDNYDPETGKVYYDATKFVEGMADPCIYWDETTQTYYMTGSYFPEDGDAMEGETTEQYDRVVLRKGKTLEDLQKRENQVTIWKVGNQGFMDNGNEVASGYRYIWAPEIHRVGDYWVVYFTESHDANNLFNIYSHVLVLDGTKDPYETALKTSDQASEWKDYKMMRSSSVENDPFSLSFCLDMTYFKDEKNGKSYVIWAGKPTEAFQGGNTDLFIATVDETQPWIITSEAVRLTKADYGWERVRYCVNEGATVVQKNGKIFMCYSASGTGSEYAIGMLSAEQGVDLLDKNNWTKNPYPLLTSRDVNGEEGPGHNSFTVDEDGNVIFVYHARPTSHNSQRCGWNGTNSSYNAEPLNDPCRHARLKRVHWAADGTPVLRMTYEDELIDEYATVSLTINVGEGGSQISVPVESVSFNKTALQMQVGDTDTLTATVLPANATHKELEWVSSNSNVVTVNNGELKALMPGTATITAKTSNGKKAECQVTVTGIAVTSVTLNKQELVLEINGTETLQATVEPDNATDKSITWTSSDDEVASVSNGVVTGKKAGTATIKAAAVGGKYAQCQVTVKGTGTGDETVKEELETAIGTANEKIEGTKEEDYPEGVWQALKDAIEKAEQAAASGDADLMEEAKSELETALKNFKTIAEIEAEEEEAAKAEEENILKDVIDTKKPQKEEAEYPADRWAAYQNALTAAQEILNNPDATSAQIKEAREALEEAFNQLKTNAEIEAEKEEAAKAEASASLNTVINTKKPQGTQADYTPESWTAYQNALKAAQEILKDANATSAQIKAAQAALETAFGKLTKKAAVDKKVTSVKFAAKTYSIAAGKKIDLKKVVTVLPKDAKNKTLTWSIAKKYSKYATVKNGVVTTKKKGAGKTVTVTAQAADGSGKKATVKIKIMKNAVTKITVKKKSLTVKAGKKISIKAVVKTNGKKVNKKLEYTSSNEKFATVNSKGVVSAKKAGVKKTVTITVKSTDGTNKSVKVKVKIKK
ncbi:MAG: family 43 glycosylhydrolase [Lachnospiraceae bacterium]|nr:family 43 glycosylhydrolase [Lachnospiraceae bacterium]